MRSKLVTYTLAEWDDEKAQPYRMGVPLRYSATLANKVFFMRQQICMEDFILDNLLRSSKKC